MRDKNHTETRRHTQVGNMPHAIKEVPVHKTDPQVTEMVAPPAVPQGATAPGEMPAQPAGASGGDGPGR